MRNILPRLSLAAVFLVSLFQVRCSDLSEDPDTFRFQFVRTVQVTPDDHYQTGSFARVNFVPATDRLLVTFGVKNKGPLGECLGGGYAYKEFDLEMVETGNTGFFLWAPGECEANDSGSFMAGNEYYFAWVPPMPEFYGWRVLRFDAVSWHVLAAVDFTLPEKRERNNDPMLYYSGGQLDVSGQYDYSEAPPDLYTGAATHHTFFSPDLQVQGRKVLEDVPHVCGSSMIIVDGIRYLVTADAFLGDLIVMKYDAQWNYQGKIDLVKQAHWSQGLAFDGQRFFVSYLNTSQRTNNGLPVSLNVHLAAFDRSWSLIQDEALTDYRPSDLRQPGRPWVAIRNRRIYVSYDLDTLDPATREEERKWQAYVAIFEYK